MKNIIYVLILFYGQIVLGQTDLQLVSSSGNDTKGVTLDVEYSIGEPVMTYMEGDSVVLHQGFQQAFTVLINGIEDDTRFNFSYYPNPTEDFLNIKYDGSSLNDYSFQMSRVNGTLVESVDWIGVGENHVQGDLIDLATGTYTISVLDEKNSSVITTIKIIKHGN